MSTEQKDAVSVADTKAILDAHDFIRRVHSNMNGVHGTLDLAMLVEVRRLRKAIEELPRILMCKL